jgi:hypothetical protein
MIGSRLPSDVFYHVHLSMLRKTELSKYEIQLLGGEAAKKQIDRVPNKITNKVFLYDSSQPFDKNQTRKELFYKDLSDFIGLRTPLDPFPESNFVSSTNLSILDICDDEFVQLRSELIEVGISASKWIRQYLLDSPDVMVSSREWFEKILLTWLEDPCGTKPPPARRFVE